MLCKQITVTEPNQCTSLKNTKKGTIKITMNVNQAALRKWRFKCYKDHLNREFKYCIFWNVDRQPYSEGARCMISKWNVHYCSVSTCESGQRHVRDALHLTRRSAEPWQHAYSADKYKCLLFKSTDLLVLITENLQCYWTSTHNCLLGTPILFF